MTEEDEEDLERTLEGYDGLGPTRCLPPPPRHHHADGSRGLHSCMHYDLNN